MLVLTYKSHDLFLQSGQTRKICYEMLNIKPRISTIMIFGFQVIYLSSKISIILKNTPHIIHSTKIFHQSLEPIHKYDSVASNFFIIVSKGLNYITISIFSSAVTARKRQYIIIPYAMIEFCRIINPGQKGFLKPTISTFLNASKCQS